MKNLAINKELTLDELAELWRQTKAAYDQYRKDLIGLEDAMLLIVDAKQEGSETTRTAHYKITTTGRLNRKCDWKKWDEIEHQIPENLRPVKVKRELDAPGCKYLEQNEPGLWRIIAQCIETKPGKVGFTVEPIGDK